MSLTDEEKRMIREYHPNLGDRPPGIDLAAIIEREDAATQAAAEATAAAAQASGKATILNGTTSIAVACGAAFNGKYPVVSFGEQPTAAGLKWLSASIVAAGSFTITIDQDNTADLDVHWAIC